MFSFRELVTRCLNFCKKKVHSRKREPIATFPSTTDTVPLSNKPATILKSKISIKGKIWTGISKQEDATWNRKLRQLFLKFPPCSLGLVRHSKQATQSKIYTLVSAGKNHVSRINHLALIVWALFSYQYVASHCQTRLFPTVLFILQLDWKKKGNGRTV